jgi:hypothetical protein
MALATSAQAGLMHPSKVENWLTQSNLYANLETTVVSKAQSAIANNVSGGVSISKTVVQQAATSAFPQSLLKQSVQTFLNGNYAWLEGKTPIPSYTIDLSSAKQQFATKVAMESVLAHLTGLPTCTAAQTLALESANPLLLSCLPAGVSPQFEASQVSQQLVTSSDFLSNPVITARTVSTKGLNENKPYYTKFSALPKGYQFAEKLPWILSIVSIISILGIMYCARSRCSGIRRISIILLISGLLLVATSFATDVVFNKLRERVFTKINEAQIQPSLTSFTHYLAAELAKIDLWSGIAYIVLAVLLLGVLLLTRRHAPKSAREGKLAPQTNDIPRANQSTLQPIPRTNTPQRGIKNRSGPRPPRLIQ